MEFKLKNIELMIVISILMLQDSTKTNNMPIDSINTLNFDSYGN